MRLAGPQNLSGRFGEYLMPYREVLTLNARLSSPYHAQYTDQLTRVTQSVQKFSTNITKSVRFYL